jgi:hypothetical protein
MFFVIMLLWTFLTLFCEEGYPKSGLAVKTATIVLCAIPDFEYFMTADSECPDIRSNSS